MVKSKTTTKKSSNAKAKQVPMRSFRPSPEPSPFLFFKLTQQTVYWFIVCTLILGLGIWVITLTVKVQSLYDQVQMQSQTNSTSKDTQSN